MTIKLLDGPASIDDAWEEIVEASFNLPVRGGNAAVVLAAVANDVAVLQLPPGSYRARFSAINYGESDLHRQEGSDEWLEGCMSCSCGRLRQRRRNASRRLGLRPSQGIGRSPPMRSAAFPMAVRRRNALLAEAQKKQRLSRLGMALNSGWSRISRLSLEGTTLLLRCISFERGSHPDYAASDLIVTAAPNVQEVHDYLVESKKLAESKAFIDRDKIHAALVGDTIVFTNLDDQIMKVSADFASCKRQPMDRNEVVRRLEYVYRTLDPVQHRDQRAQSIFNQYAAAFNRWATDFEPASVIEPKA